jgi:hypothetical protein
MDDLTGLSNCLRSHGQMMKHLRLAFAPDWNDIRKSDESDDDRENFLQLASPGLSLPCLESLLLSDFSFKSALNELAECFNFSGLSKLKLWNCPGSTELLKNLVESMTNIRLTSLEFVQDSDEYSIWEENATLGRFLQAFSDLQDLFILLNLSEWDIVTDTAVSHVSTFRRVVLHYKGVDADDELVYFEDDVDGGIPWDTTLTELIVEGECEFFAKWAFGADGLPELQVLAFGDFALTFSGRDVEGNRLYRRAEPTSLGDCTFRSLFPRTKRCGNGSNATWML